MTQPAVPPRAKQVILVVDDDPAVRESLKFALEVEGFAVRTYADGSELLNNDDLPAGGCLIIDFHMPAMNGLDVLAKLRDRRNLMPAILVTSHPNAIIRNRAAASGIPVVEKPFQGSALMDSIRKAIDGHLRSQN